MERIERRNMVGWFYSLKGNNSPGRPRRKWLDNIKMHLRDVDWGGVYLIRVSGYEPVSDSVKIRNIPVL